MNDYESELKKMCEEAAVRFKSQAEGFGRLFNFSLEEGAVHPTDVYRTIKFYEDLIELKTLLNLYNKWFPHDVTRKAEADITQLLDETRNQVRGIMIRNI